MNTVTFLGHAALQINFGGKIIIVDPFISGNPLAKDIDINKLEADYILITHGHTDHLLDAEQIAKNTNALIISNFEIVTWFEKKGLKGHGMNIGGKHSFNFGTLKYVNAIHSSEMPDGTYGGNPGGFVLWNNEASIYIAGDTALTLDMKLIPLTCPKLDLAILPIGDNFTMGYKDALIASNFIECDHIMAYHFDTFPPIKINHQVVKNYFSMIEKNIILPTVGETIEIKHF